MDRTDVVRAARCVLGAWPVVLATASLVGCGAPETMGGDTAGHETTEIISGNDDRKEVYAHENAWMRSYAEQATVALIRKDFFLEFVSGGRTYSYFLNNGYTLGEARDLCPNEPFAEQRAVADCSGTLIDDDLVLTAGHCMAATDACANMRFMFNYHYTAAGALHASSPDAVFSCRRIEALSVPASGSDMAPDYAIVRLDRSAVPRFQPAPVRRASTPLDAGQHVKIVGFPDGIPAKIDMEGNVGGDLCAYPTGGYVRCGTTALPRAGYFDASLDVFGSNSGSGVYESDGYTLAGVLRGSPFPDDYTPRTLPDGTTCNVRTFCTTTDCPTAVAFHARLAIDALCVDPSRSARLCGVGAPVNDRCVDATHIDVQFGRQQTFSGSTAGGTNDFTAPCGSGTSRSPDVFYKFTPTVPTIVYADTYTSDFSAVVYVRAGCALADTRIQCSASSCGIDRGQIATVVQPGQTYYLGVIGRGGTSGRYNLHVQFLPASDRAVALRPVDVTTAPPVPLRAGSFSGIVAGDTTGFASRAAGTCGGTGGDHTYYFTTCPDFRGGTVRAWTTGLASWDTVIHSRQGHSPTTGCNDNSSSTVTTSVLRTDAAPGAGLQALYLDGNVGRSGPYSMRYAVSAP
jgi:hypothetical protein